MASSAGNPVESEQSEAADYFRLLSAEAENG
jgi:hypothetical protein